MYYTSVYDIHLKTEAYSIKCLSKYHSEAVTLLLNYMAIVLPLGAAYHAIVYAHGFAHSIWILFDEICSNNK